MPHTALVKEMTQNMDFARFVTDILPGVLRQGGTGLHRVLVAFHTGVTLNFIARSKNLDEGTLAYLLPASLESVHYHSGGKTDIKPTILKESIVRILYQSSLLCRKFSLELPIFPT